MSIFFNSNIANNYDSYYETEEGRKIDEIEKNIISELLPIVPDNSMLELGCGSGHWTQFFVEKGFKVTGVDMSQAMLNIARQKKIGAQLLLANCENLPFADYSYSFIATITMLEFVDDIDKVIKEIYRVLKKGGYLIIGFLNADSVIATNRASGEVLKNAQFLSVTDVKTKFNQLKLLQIKSGVYLNQDYSIIENANSITDIPPVFIGALFQKV